MKIIEVLEGFNPDGRTIDTIRDVWIPRARKKHTELIELSAKYSIAFDEADLEGLAVDRSRLRVAVNRAAHKIRRANEAKAGAA